MMAKLAKALQVSIKFLTDDECEDPVADIERTITEEARERYGAKGAVDGSSFSLTMRRSSRAANFPRIRRTPSSRPS